MNCKKCGIRLDSSWKVCPECGTETESVKLCPGCGYKLMEGWKVCPECGTALEEAKADDGKAPENDGNAPVQAEGAEKSAEENKGQHTYGWNNTQPGDTNMGGTGTARGAYGQPYQAGGICVHPMKWYNFLVKFWLIFDAICCFLEVIESVLSMFNGSGPVIGEFFKVETSMPFLVFEAVVYAVMGVYAIKARQILHGRSKNSMMAIVVYFALPLLTSLGMVIFFPSVGTAGDLIADLIVNGLIIWGNVVYFRKRSDYFVN